MNIKHFTGKELIEFTNNEIQPHLDYFNLEYFFQLYSNKNYIILMNDDNKIMGQITYTKKRNQFLLVSISITNNHKNKGYSKLLMNEYSKLIKGIFNLTQLSEEGEFYLSRFFDLNEIEIDIIKESEF